MDYKDIDKEVAKALTVALIEKSFFVVNADDRNHPDKLGESVAALYFAVLDKISK